MKINNTQAQPSKNSKFVIKFGRLIGRKGKCLRKGAKIGGLQKRYEKSEMDAAEEGTLGAHFTEERTSRRDV